MRDTTSRLASLDAFRGFTIAAMVLVNNPGDWANLYSQLEHAKWNGWTFTDCIFPFFLFIGGVAMALSLGQARRADLPDRLPAQLHALL
jgi:predicted acyltransferase